MTTNCLMPVLDSYKDHLFSVGPVGFPGGLCARSAFGTRLFLSQSHTSRTTISNHSSTKLFRCPDSRKTNLSVDILLVSTTTPSKAWPIRSGRYFRLVVVGYSDPAQLVDAIKTGKIRRFFLIGGCDGHEPSRNYYTELAERVQLVCLFARSISRVVLQIARDYRDCIVLTLACGKV